MTDPAALFRLEGRVACVTGASSGLGRHAADVLVQAGARVVGTARRAEALAEWAAQAGENAAGVAADVADRDALHQTVAAISAPFGTPDIIVHAAGLNTREAADDVTPDGWDRTLAINLTAPFFLTQAIAPAMAAKGWGRVVNFASLQSTRAFPGGIAYGATKGGVSQLTRAMAEAWSSKGIMVNAIGPGFFPTELTAAVFDDPDRAARNAAQTCVGRNGMMSDMDGPLLFLCSDASAYVTGQTLMVDGGFTAK
ncbi:SDR family oxidoreductase [uncultured Sulfitobacter sp.]|uniref:SDR family NAD(P)-dependent oxidoreductase n=1 Tax=uncultured Sulfitobacter sp. TaxID=191468 RepID=UPI00261B5F65|nr:SDR family oxidoreductase [uncultured Sulfitobacter sp.]